MLDTYTLPRIVLWNTLGLAYQFKKTKVKNPENRIKAERKICMARYTAEESKSMEYQGAETFRIENDGGKAQVVFLYTDEKSVDGWSCHRLPGAHFYTYTVDCPRGPKDDVDKCPACKAGEQLSTRVFVLMLDVNSGKVMIWDKPASYRKEITSLMSYYNPLYKQKFEITREGTGLNTKYRTMPIGDSGLTEKQYKDFLAKANEVCDSYVRPIEKYEEIKARSLAAQAEQVQVDNQKDGNPQQSAWGQNMPPQGGQQNWGGAPQGNQQGWGAAPQQGWGSQPQQAQPSQQAPQQAPQPSGQQGWAPQGSQPGWGAAPNGAWQNNPQQK